MSERVRGRVINLHALGATVRLENGDLASVPRAELDRDRPAFARSMQTREPLTFDRDGRVVRLVRPSADELIAETARTPANTTDDAFESRLNDYLRQTEEWAPPDRPEPAERHLFRKRQRARLFAPRDGSTPPGA